MEFLILMINHLINIIVKYFPLEKPTVYNQIIMELFILIINDLINTIVKFFFQKNLQFLLLLLLFQSVEFIIKFNRNFMVQC